MKTYLCISVYEDDICENFVVKINRFVNVFGHLFNKVVLVCGWSAITNNVYDVHFSLYFKRDNKENWFIIKQNIEVWLWSSIWFHPRKNPNKMRKN